MRILLLTVLSLIAFIASSQEVENRHYLSANMAWSRQSFFQPNYSFQLTESSVGYGYFIKKNLALGLDLLYSNTTLVQDFHHLFLIDSVSYPTRFTDAKGFGIAPNVFVRIPFKKAWSFIAKGSLPVIAYQEEIWNNRIPRGQAEEGSSYIAVCFDASVGLQYEFASGAAIQFSPLRMNMVGYKKGSTSIYESRSLLQAALGAYLRF